MADVKQCNTCRYWHSLSGWTGGVSKACNHLLETGRRRVEVDGVCKSCTGKKRK